MNLAPHLVLPLSSLPLYIPDPAANSSNSRRFTFLSHFRPQLFSFHTLLFSIFSRPFLFNRLGTAPWGVGGLALGSPAPDGLARVGVGRQPHTCHPERTGAPNEPGVGSLGWRGEGSAFRRLYNSPSQAAPSSPASSFHHYFVTSLLHLSRGSLCLTPLSSQLPIPAVPISTL